MSTKNQNTKEAQARGRVVITGKIKEARVSQAQTIIGQIKTNPAYANTPKVQECTAAFEAATNALSTNLASIKAARTALVPLLASRVTLDADMRRTQNTLEAVITDVGKGSAEAIQQWGLAVAGRTPTPLSNDPPGDLKASYNRSLQLVLRWKGIRSHIGYLLEIGDGTPTGWAQPITLATARFIPTGLIPGQKVAFRVAVRRKSGLSDYSDMLTVTVR
jgi:hypothetical protein